MRPSAFAFTGKSMSGSCETSGCRQVPIEKYNHLSLKLFHHTSQTLGTGTDFVINEIFLDIKSSGFAILKSHQVDGGQMSNLMKVSMQLANATASVVPG